MSEVEFDIMLDAVRSAMAPIPGENLMLATHFSAPPCAANDNDTVWPLLPFPEGWYAAC